MVSINGLILISKIRKPIEFAIKKFIIKCSFHTLKYEQYYWNYLEKKVLVIKYLANRSWGMLTQFSLWQ
jgi:hypothetical protein